MERTVERRHHAGVTAVMVSAYRRVPWRSWGATRGTSAGSMSPTVLCRAPVPYTCCSGVRHGPVLHQPPEAGFGVSAAAAHPTSAVSGTTVIARPTSRPLLQNLTESSAREVRV